MDVETARVIGFGVLEGSSSFLPISPSGHVALAEMLFLPNGLGTAERLFLVTGTLIVTLVVTGPLLAGIWGALICRARGLVSRGVVPAERDLAALAMAQVAIAVLWYALGDARSELSRQPTVIALGLGITSLVLVSTAWMGPRARLHPTLIQAFLLGAVQGIGLVPGISAIGCSIVAAMWMGVTARRSLELSLLISLPVSVTWVVTLLRETTHWALPTGVGLLGLAAAAASGYAAVRLLRLAVMRERIAWFSLWVMPLAVAAFAFGRVWPVR